LDHPRLRHRYEERFDGVLLAHETTLVDEDIKDDGSEVKGKKKIRAKILNGLVPYFGVRVHANLLIFSPQPDMILGKLLYFFGTPL
jgi:hypothetical protein